MLRRALQLAPVSSFLLLFTEADGDFAVFCYRMGVDIFSAGAGTFLASITLTAKQPRLQLAALRSRQDSMAALPKPKRNQVACSNLFSTFSARFLTPED